MLLFIGLLITTTWLARWHVILTGSMAPTLLGTHCDVTCANCGFEYAIEAERQLKQGQIVVCPNCDHSEELETARIRSGDRVLVWRSIVDMQPPQRWDMITLRMPKQSKEFGVKRIIGLPGERIQLRDGDVYIDGYLVRKSLKEQRAIAILVHDADYPPRGKKGAKSRWRGGPDSHWETSGGTFRCSGENATTDWLVYHNERRQGGPGKFVEGPITDRYAYNQTSPIRDLHPTGDVMMTCRARFAPKASWSIRATDRKTPYIVTFDGLQERFELRQGFRMLTSQELKLGESHEHALVVSLIDRRYEIALDGRSLYQLDLDMSSNSIEPSAQPFAIGLVQGSVEIDQLRVWRDVYYTVPPVLGQKGNAPPGRALFQPYTLGDDEYFLLGDNSPRSLDSRYMSFGIVTASLLVGEPVWEFR